MNSKSVYRFLDEDAKREEFARTAGLHLQPYRHKTFIKIYSGARILLYHYDFNYQPVFDKILECQKFWFSNKVMLIELRDIGSNQLIELTEVPVRIPGTDIIGHVPYRCIVEKTLKRAGNGVLLDSMTAAVMFLSRSSLTDKQIAYPQAIKMVGAQKILGLKDYALALKKWEEKNGIKI